MSIGQLEVWRRQGRLAPRDRRGGGGRHGTLLFSAPDVLEVAEWARRSMSESAAAKRLRLLATTVRALAEAGELGEWREYAARREYDRAAVERYAEKRERMISMREASRLFALPWWVIRRFVDEGLLPVRGSGAKGSFLIDPLDLKPLLEAKPCGECGELLPPGRISHPFGGSRCFQRTPEFRESAKRWISNWWASPASEAFREKLRDLPCPNCGKTFTITEPTFAHRETRNAIGVFCSQSCGAKYRWQHGVNLDAFARTLPPRGRQRWFGRWNGDKGAVAGIEGGYKGGRPWAATVEQSNEIVRLHAERLSYREISARVFGDARYKDRVSRVLKLRGPVA